MLVFFRSQPRKLIPVGDNTITGEKIIPVSMLQCLAFSLLRAHQCFSSRVGPQFKDDRGGADHQQP